MLGQMIEDKIDNNLTKETLLSKDLLDMHAEDESDLYGLPVFWSICCDQPMARHG